MFFSLRQWHEPSVVVIVLLPMTNLPREYRMDYKVEIEDRETNKDSLGVKKYSPI